MDSATAMTMAGGSWPLGVRWVVLVGGRERGEPVRVPGGGAGDLVCLDEDQGPVASESEVMAMLFLGFVLPVRRFDGQDAKVELLRPRKVLSSVHPPCLSFACFTSCEYSEV